MSFDRIAPHYRWLERVLAGRVMQRCRTAFLEQIASPRHALLAGEGHGRFLVELLQRHPQTRITVVDASAGMLAQARRNAERQGVRLERTEFIHADLLDWQPLESAFDLIATHFFFDCFSPAQIESLVERLALTATPTAPWLLADFRVPPSGPARWRAELILWSLYRFFRWNSQLSAVRLTVPDGSLARHGFTLQERRVFDWGLLHSDLWVRRAS
jgi:ubiquinone/menaquinone biosynthesis C-methylase UbiE